MKNVRTRLAPSPTGQDLHIGNAYTALICYAFAKKYGGQFIIRLEDTDRTRFIEGSEQRILSSLQWLGLEYTEGPDRGGQFAPYRQSERLQLYQRYAQELLEQGKAYYCFCTTETLAQMREQQQQQGKPTKYDRRCMQLDKKTIEQKLKSEPHVIRMKIPEGHTTFVDVIRGNITIANTQLDDQVLIKSDGFPTYHMAVVIDDHEMNISHVIRGEDWISSTPKHVLLYSFFGWEMPVFAHLPLLRNPDRSKLSKRKNPVWVSWYSEEGFLPQAVANYLALMGWSHPDGKEIFPMSEYIDQFSLERIQTVGPIFDLEKLRWMNGQYLMRMSNEEVKNVLHSFFHHFFDEQILMQTIPLIKERIKTLKEYEDMAGFFYQRPQEFEKPLNKKWLDGHIATLSQLSVQEWTHERLEQDTRTTADKLGVKAREYFMQLRLAVTGKTIGPPLLDSIIILGKDETLLRLRCSRDK